MFQGGARGNNAAQCIACASEGIQGIYLHSTKQKKNLVLVNREPLVVIEGADIAERSEKAGRSRSFFLITASLIRL